MWKDLRPQRTHKQCVLLWRLPNEEVPLVMAWGNWYGGVSAISCAHVLLRAWESSAHVHFEEHVEGGGCAQRRKTEHSLFSSYTKSFYEREGNHKAHRQHNNARAHKQSL